MSDLNFKPGVQEQYDAVDWSNPDWEFLYHQLLYEVKPHNIYDKRTHREAHEETLREARRLRASEDELVKQVKTEQLEAAEPSDG